MSVLPDRSFRLVGPEHSAEAVLSPYWANLTTLQACLQCGTCTANCSSVGEHSHFPRRQMNLFQMGQQEQLAADPNVWYCYNCGDCSKRCPAGARPGKLMGAVRQMAVERFAFPAFMPDVINRPQRWWLAVLAAAALLLGVIALGGSFSPVTDRVHYASVLPHRTLNVFFFAFTGLALAGLAAGATRAWSTYQGEQLWQASPQVFLHAFRKALADVLAHRRFSACAEHRVRGYAHLAVFYGFIALAGLAAVAALLIATGGRYPFPATHPLKTLGNIAAGLLILGTVYFIYERWIASAQSDPSTYFDWLLLANLLLIGITGVLCEVFRYLSIPLAAYPVYFLHLVLVLVLLVSLPYSKLAHICYRVVALTSGEYDVLLATGPSRQTIPAGQGLMVPLLDPAFVTPAGISVATAAVPPVLTRNASPGE